MLAGGGVKHAVHKQRSRLQIEIRPRAEILGLEPPRDLQGVEVGAADLIERRVAGRAKIATPCPPFTVGGAILGASNGGGQKDESDGRADHRASGSGRNWTL